MTTPGLKEHRIEENLLILTWSDQRICHYDLLALRRDCPCAICCGGHSIDSVPITGNITEIELRGVEKVGRYGLRMLWSDGHSDGIYTLADLRTACDATRQHECQKEGAESA